MSANGETIEVGKCGVLNVRVQREEETNFTLAEVFGHESFQENLLSVRKLTSKGYNVLFNNEVAQVVSKNMKHCILSAPFDGYGWRVKFEIKGKGEGGTVLIAKEVGSSTQGTSGLVKRKIDDVSGEEDSPLRKTYKLEGPSEGILWHKHLGHASVSCLRKLGEKIKELKSVRFTDELKDCEDCIRAKFAAQPCETIRERAGRPLQLIHTDVCISFPTSFRNHRTMFVSFIDDYSRYS